MGQNLIIYAAIASMFLLGIFISVKYFGKLLDYIIENTSRRGIKNGPWKTHLGIGRKHIPRIEKAAIARVGLGANNSDETIYWNAFTDSNEESLHSDNNYEIKFNERPLVKYFEKGFWSITVYGADKFLVPNPDKKYVIRSDFDNSSKNELGFSILLSSKKPENYSNWLPIPENSEKFSIALRCYIPEEKMKSNSTDIVMPAIIKI